MVRKVATLFIVAFAFASCGTAEEFLTIDLLSDSAFLIPAETTSCRITKDRENSLPTDPAPRDISPKYFTIRDITLIWKHAYNTLFVTGIFVKFKGSNLKSDYTCSIVDQDLFALIDGDPANDFNYIPWDTIMPPKEVGNYDAEQTITTNCHLRCGGVSTVDRDFTMSGTIEVWGVHLTPDGVEIPVKTYHPFSIENRK
jgi:hypothetical protein